MHILTEQDYLRQKQGWYLANYLRLPGHDSRTHRVTNTDVDLNMSYSAKAQLQSFCESCNKCACECPAGAITAVPKLMFNGYQIWKSDSQKCTTYRITTPGGAMCGRCMKNCPWNLEGIFKETPFRWAVMNIPGLAPVLAKLDDAVGNGSLNPIKNGDGTWKSMVTGATVRPASPSIVRKTPCNFKVECCINELEKNYNIGTTTGKYNDESYRHQTSGPTERTNRR